MVDKEILVGIINQALICRITIELPSVLHQTSRVVSANAMFFILFFYDVVFVRYNFLHNLQDYFLSNIHFYYISSKLSALLYKYLSYYLSYMVNEIF